MLGVICIYGLRQTEICTDDEMVLRTAREYAKQFENRTVGMRRVQEAMKVEDIVL